MLWCIPFTFSFGNPAKRNKSNSSSPRMKISGPVGLDDPVRRMQFQRHHPDNVASDAGPFYLVTNKHGPPNTIIRRAPVPPPPPPPPQEDDYDTMTQAPTTTAQKADTDWAGRTRGSPMTGVSSMPVEDNFDGATYTIPGGADSNTDSAWRTPSNRTRDRAPPRVPAVPKERYFPQKSSTNSQSPVSGSRTAFDAIENYGEYGLYVQEMDRMFVQDGEIEATAERRVPDMGHVGHKGLGRIKSREVTRTHPMARSPNPGHNLAHQSRFDTGPHFSVNPGNRNRKSRPRPPQEYEVFNRRVVEDTPPEKTATIATWRAQVARETTPNDVETMSIHYMGLEDYAAAERSLTEVDSNVQSAQRTLHETGRSDSIRSTRPADEPSKDAIPPVVDYEESPPASPIEPAVPRPPTPPQKSSNHLPQIPQASNHHSQIPQTRSASSHSRNHSTPPRIATPDRIPIPKYPRSPRAGVRRTVPVYSDSNPLPEPPRSPSPPHIPPPSPFTFNTQPSFPMGVNANTNNFALHLPPQSPLQESTPIRTSMSPVPFRPRQSQGSTISSIKSESVREFEQILDACQPSLLHIAPVLTRLGITNIEHLKAVIRLSEEMRDREVREEALRMGVTRVEWAMLLHEVSKL